MGPNALTGTLPTGEDANRNHISLSKNRCILGNSVDRWCAICDAVRTVLL